MNYIENLIKIAKSESYLARINNSVILKAEQANQPKDVLTKQFEIFDDLFDSYVVTTPPPLPPPPPPPIEEIIIVEDDECEEYYYDEDDGILYEQDCSEPYVVEPVTLPVIEPKEDKPEDDFFVVVEQMPQLLGGLAALQGKVSYPEMAREAGTEGRVTVQFIVNEQGRVENPRVIRGIGDGCDEEALKAVQSARFTPGMQSGRPVRVQYSLPIVFRLQN